MSHVGIRSQAFLLHHFEQRPHFILRCRTLNANELRTADSGDRVSHTNWEPRIRILNLIGVERWRMRPSVATIASAGAPRGELEFKYTIAGVLAEPFQLSLFPFDTQTLTITLSSAIPSHAIRFHPRGGGEAFLTTTPWPAVCSRRGATGI